MNGIYDISFSDEQKKSKEEILNKLNKVNKAGLVFDEIIHNYSVLYEKYMSSRSLAVKSEIARSTLSNSMMQSLSPEERDKEFSRMQEELAQIRSSNAENLNSLNKSLVYSIELKDKLEKAEKECSVLRPEIEKLREKCKALDKRNKELDEISKKQDQELAVLKKTNLKLENDNRTFNEQLNKLKVDNQLLTNKILALQEDQMAKMNEYNEIYESARKKKAAADMYYSEKQKSFKNTQVPPNFQVNVEDVIIPKTIKYKFKSHNKGINSITFNGFGSNFLTTGTDNFIKNWDCSKYQELNVYSNFTSAVTDACYDHSEQFLFAGSMDKTAKLWTLKNNKLTCTFTGHIDYVNCVGTFYSSLKGLTGSSDRTIKEWDFQSQKLSRNFSCVSACHCLGIAYDDSFIISGHLDGTVKIWSNNDKPDKVIELHDDKVLHLEILKNENQFLTISKDYSIKLFDIRKMESVYTVSDKTLPQYCESSISVSSDKKYFAVGSTKGTIYICNLKDGTIEDTIELKGSKNILALRWRPFHSQLYVGDAAGFLTILGTK